MIIDTTYLLPHARIRIDKDLLKAIADNKIELTLEDITINAISIFELQAKAAKFRVPANFVIEAGETILTAFRIEEFHKPKIIEIADEIRELIPDYIDCVIVTTAVLKKDYLITEESLILSRRDQIKQRYGINILNFRK